jgi:hypothetical protein
MVDAALEAPGATSCRIGNVAPMIDPAAQPQQVVLLMWRLNVVWRAEGIQGIIHYLLYPLSTELFNYTGSRVASCAHHARELGSG